MSEILGRSSLRKGIFLAAAAAAFLWIPGCGGSGTAYVTFLSSSGGTVTGTLSDDSGTEIELGTAYEQEGNATFTVEAEAEEGYRFGGWIDGSGTVVSNDAEYTGKGGEEESWTLEALFVPEDAAAFYILESGSEEEETEEAAALYYCLDLAIAAAGDSGTLVVYAGEDGDAGTVYGSEGQTEFTIPEGVTLLLPYDPDSLDLGGSYGEEDSWSSTEFLHSQSWGDSFDVDAGCTLELTVSSGTEITVEGALVIGGQVNSEANCAAGAPCGSHAVLRLEGSLVIASGGVLSACGYVCGGGTVAAQPGSELYEPMAILDYLGGGYTAAAAGNASEDATALMSFVSPLSGEDYVMPFNRYALQNFQAELVLEEGAVLYAYVDLYANSSDNVTIGVIVGDSTTPGLITLSEGAELQVSYDSTVCVAEYPEIGRTSLAIQGGASLGSLDLSLEFMGTAIDLNTSAFLFPLPYNFEVSLNGGTYDMDSSFAIYPGAVLEVGSDAVLNVGTGESCIFLVYDGMMEYTSISTDSSLTSVEYSADHTGDTSNNDYPSAAQLQAAGLSRAGSLVVNGALNIGSDSTASTFAGLIQTASSWDEATLSGPVVTVSSTVTTSYTAQVGAAGEYSLLGLKTYYTYGGTVYRLSAQLVRSEDGEETDLEAGETWYGAAGEYVDEGFTFTFYGDAEDVSASEEYTVDASEAVSGAWYR